MKYLILFLILMNGVFALNSISIEKNDIINIESYSLEVLRITEDKVLLRENDKITHLELKKSMNLDEKLSITLNSINNEKANILIDNKYEKERKEKQLNIHKIITLSLFILIIFLSIIYFKRKSK